MREPIHEIVYYIPAHGETEEDCDSFMSVWDLKSSDKMEHRWAVEDLCQHMWDSRDGWEWMVGSDANIIIIVDGIHLAYTFQVESVPQFSVREVK